MGRYKTGMTKEMDIDMINKIKSIEEYGRRYVERYLAEQIQNRESYLSDWKQSLELVFSKTFYRGRKDEISETFMGRTLKVLQEFDLDNKYDPQLLEDKLKAGGVNNRHDRKMVAGVIDFTRKLPDVYRNNIVAYSVKEIKSGNIRNIFNELDSIHAIGDKLASFYLRDIVIIYELQDFLTDTDLRYCQPVDTWVMQVSLKLGIIDGEGAKEDVVKEAIIAKCKEANVSSLFFDAGAWMIGTNSLEFLLEKL